MSNVSAQRASDLHEYATAGNNTEVVAELAAVASARHHLTSLSASYSATTSGELDMYGLSKVGPMDLTDDDVLDLTGDTFTLSGHGLTNGDQVVFHSLGDTAPTGLTSGNTYFVVGVSGADFQLSATSGGSAINMSGTQANFTEEAVILPLSKSWEIYDALDLQFHSPLIGPFKTPLILKLEAVTSITGKVNASAYSS